MREISIGAWDGLDRDGIAALAPRIFDGDGRHEWYFRTPDGETYDDFAARIAAWLADPRATALSLPVPQDRIFHLAGGTIAEIEITEA